MLYIKQRSFMPIIVMLLLAMMVSACNTTSNTVSQPNNEGKSSAEKKTKVFRDATGEIEIPIHPERIVSITFLGDLAALGVKPVGAGSIALENSVLLSKELEGVENVGDVSIEKVMQLKPDLIIVPTYLPTEITGQLKKIAPTVSLPSGTLEGTDPIEEVRTFGELVGKEAEAEAFITRYKQKAEAAKEKVKSIIGSNETVGSYSIWAKNFWVWPKTRDAGYNLMEMFELKPVEKVKKEIFPTGQGKDISLELLSEYAADHMFISVYEPDGGAERAKEIMSSPIWKNLEAVKHNHVYMLDSKKFWMTDGLNLEKQLDIIVDLLVNKNKK
ncbi:ABC transporter substrate-binding protein [Brevibacillus laterosporus]|uniref:ABC transporter substrate-binding protein n=1 Tax=Brevibacillus laterosporus TaxID=1465 RepID=UPI000B9C5861|nr:ABC transporter substrate-binding protein [Brevibacillus laterosporus]MCG7316985.1 ABC transporter substrate-binding protein [Brevibacillus laterosporus]MED1786671.1 ABC transporter substrate-binding protein [Brevibacillus laterosporus]